MDSSTTTELPSWHIRWTIVVATFSVVLGCTWTLYHYVDTVENAHLQATFSKQTSSLRSRLNDQFGVYLEVVLSLANLHQALGEMPEEHFDRFVATSLERHRVIQALEWIPRVPTAEREAYEAARRKAGHLGFSFKRWSPTRTPNWQDSRVPWAKEDYFPVYFVRPILGNEAAVGIDLASHPTRLFAMQKARVTGQPIATAGITLAQETGDRSGFLIFVPVYDSQDLDPTLDWERKREWRSEHLAGFAVGVFRVEDIVNSALSEEERSRFSIKITDDNTSRRSKRLLFRSVYPQQAAEANSMVDRFPVTVAGRTWAIDIAATPQFKLASEKSYAWLVLLSGGLLAFLLSGIVYVVVDRSEGARVFALQRGEEIKESQIVQRRVFEAAPIGLAIVDSTNTIRYSNPALQRIFEYSESQLSGRHVEVLLSRKQQNAPEGVAQLANTIFQYNFSDDARHILGVKSSGEEIEIEVSCVQIPLPDDLGTLATVKDITEQRKSEEAQKRNNESMARFNKAAVDREKRMSELKQEVNQLLDAAGQPTRYRTQ